jgi:hypothetical protein
LLLAKWLTDSCDIPLLGGPTVNAQLTDNPNVSFVERSVLSSVSFDVIVAMTANVTIISSCLFQRGS